MKSYREHDKINVIEASNHALTSLGARWGWLHLPFTLGPYEANCPKLVLRSGISTDTIYKPLNWLTCLEASPAPKTNGTTLVAVTSPSVQLLNHLKAAKATFNSLPLPSLPT